MPKQIHDENANKSGSSDEEKPLKKARFVWELKGKHHLKKSNQTSAVINDENNEEETVSETNNNTNQHIQTKMDIVENRPTNSKSGCNSCTKTLLEKTSDDINNELDKISNEIKITERVLQNKDFYVEFYLYKWHARQIARSFVDNTVNRLLENWSNSPLPPDVIDYYANSGQVEQNAILMAIRSHGLQSSTSDLSATSFGLEQDAIDDRNSLLDEFTQDNQENAENEQLREQEFDFLQESNSNPNELISINQDSLDMEDSTDFLNAAVSVAIQKKGLSYEY